MSGRSNTQIILFIATLVAIGPMATDLYLPALPALTQAFDAGYSQVQLTLSIFFIGFAIGQLVYGPLSDRFGRKPVLLIGLTIFIISSAAAAFANTIESLIVIRLFQALGGCAGPVLGRAMVRDLYDPQEGGRMLSHIASAMALAPAVAPIIGGFLTALFGWEANFWFLLAYGLLALAVLTFGLPETIRRKNPDATKMGHLIRNYRTLIHHQRWRLYTLICSFIFAGLFAFLSGSSFVLIEYLGVSEQQYGFLFATIVVGYVIGSQMSARLTIRYRAFILIRLGCWVGLIAGAAMLLLSMLGAHSVTSIIAPQFFFMMAVGMVLPLSLAGALAPFPHMAGAASALLGTTQMLIAAAHGGLVGYLYTGTPTVMASGIAFAGLAAFVAMKRLKYVGDYASK